MERTYIERATDVAWNSHIAVTVLLNRANDDIELIPLRARPFNEYITPEEFTARQLRSVGVVALQGLKPLCAFKEPLPPSVVNAVANAFLEYVRTLLGGTFAEHLAVAEIAELERIHSFPDTRN